MLEEDRAALDRVAVKLEKELREVMNTEGEFCYRYLKSTVDGKMPVITWFTACKSDDLFGYLSTVVDPFANFNAKNFEIFKTVGTRLRFY